MHIFWNTEKWTQVKIALCFMSIFHWLTMLTNLSPAAHLSIAKKTGRGLFIILHNLIKFHKNLSGLSPSAPLRHISSQNDIMLSQRHSLATNKEKLEQRNKELACTRSRDLYLTSYQKNIVVKRKIFMWHYQVYGDWSLSFAE